MLSKSPAEYAPSSGRISTSLRPQAASEACTFCSVRMLSICSATLEGRVIWSRGSSGVPRFTAMTTSAPMARATSTGRLRVSPPSTSILPSICTGATAPGTDMLARIAVARSPGLKTTIWPVTTSVAMARKGIGSLSKSLVALGQCQPPQHGLERDAGDHALGQRQARRRGARTAGR